MEQNDFVKVVDLTFEICCTAVDLVKAIEFEHEINDNARDDVAKVVESEYEIHSKACDDLVNLVESEYIWDPSQGM